MKKLTTLLVMLLFTAGMAIGQNNEATIDQVGDDNNAEIEQIGSLNKAFVDQLAQGTTSGVATFSDADIYQDGSENFVNIDQNAFFQFSNATITQEGDRNIVEGTTSESAWVQSNGGLTLEVLMDGDDNRLYSLRGEAQKNANELYLDVIGNNNTVGAEQEGAYADLDITGDSNNVVLSQLGDNSVYNTADIDVIGDGNGVNVMQTMNSNSAVVNINGGGNTSTINQN